ncbi:MAG: YdeI/OmpD-associated family protein [Bacteroidota bacterium]|nr:YdeI/OmpD-associated family protein [Bacteroidota bacterium]MDP4250708.1 YdeI/OmpD-associated family protein [Bacteroidota bacterium]
MVQFNTRILQFNQQGEKTGWTYISIPAEIADEIKAGTKKSFRVKGKLDDHPISKAALLPMGNGNFILPLNAAIRKALHKGKGAMLKVQLQEDKQAPGICRELMECLEDAPLALKRFNALPASHRMYYSKWIESAKTIQTKSKRIALTITAMERNMTYAEMMRANAQSVNK